MYAGEKGNGRQVFREYFSKRVEEGEEMGEKVRGQGHRLSKEWREGPQMRVGE